MIERYIAEDLISSDGEIVYEKGTYLTKEMVEALKEEEFFEKGAHQYDLTDHMNKALLKDMAIVNSDNPENIERTIVNIVKVYSNENKDVVSTVIGTDLNSTIARITLSDILSIFSYFLNLMDGFGNTDDIDHLSNRRIRSVGELIQTQFRIGLTKIIKNTDKKDFYQRKRF